MDDDHPGAGSSAGGLPAGAVVVPVEANAPAAAAAEARPAWSWTRVRARVTWAGVAAAVAQVAAAAVRPPATWTRQNARLAWAAALFVLGCAAAGLAFFVMILPGIANFAAGELLRAAADVPAHRVGASPPGRLAAQVLTATMGLLVPARPFAVFGWLVGWLTAIRAILVLWLLVACNGSVHGEVAFHFWIFYAVLLAAIPVSAIASIR